MSLQSFYGKENMNPNRKGKNTSQEQQYSTRILLRRFASYYRPYLGTLALDLFCAALTTVCELVLPMMIRQITDRGMYRFDLSAAADH